MLSVLSQSKEIFSDFCCFIGGGISRNEDIMHSFQKFIAVSFLTTLPIEVRDMELVVRALGVIQGVPKK